MSTTNKAVYLDHAATTPPFGPVIAGISTFMRENFGNPSSLHVFGTNAKQALEQSRVKVAALINAEPEEITFTSGGTEADNLAIFGVANKIGKGHLITSAVEHHAVLDTIVHLGKAYPDKFSYTLVPVDQYGVVSAQAVRDVLREDTIFVSIMHANNEIGTINPIKEIGEVVHAYNPKITFHVDAVQSVGKIPVDVNELGIDLLTVSSHKINGPKGAGALYRKKGVTLQRMVYGGGQEKKLRSGTENLPGIYGFGIAAEITKEEWQEHANQLNQMCAHLVERIIAEIPEVKLNGHPGLHLPQTVNFSFNYIEGEALLLRLNLRGIACSNGSACSSGSFEPSHVLLALGLEPHWSNSSIRFSLGYGNTMEDIDYVVDTLKEQVASLRSASPNCPKSVAFCDVCSGCSKDK